MIISNDRAFRFVYLFIKSGSCGQAYYIIFLSDRLLYLYIDSFNTF